MRADLEAKSRIYKSPFYITFGFFAFFETSCRYREYVQSAGALAEKKGRVHPGGKAGIRIPTIVILEIHGQQEYQAL